MDDYSFEYKRAIEINRSPVFFYLTAASLLSRS